MCCTLMRRGAQVLVLHTTVAVAGLNRNAVQYVSPGQAQRRPGLAIPITSRYPEGVSYSIRPLQGENRITPHEPRVALRGDAAPLTLGFRMRRLQRPPKAAQAEQQGKTQPRPILVVFQRRNSNVHDSLSVGNVGESGRWRATYRGMPASDVMKSLGTTGGSISPRRSSIATQGQRDGTMWCRIASTQGRLAPPSS
jgi:hypothetical protein